MADAKAAKNPYELAPDGTAANRVDVVISPRYDGIAWHESKTGSIAEQRASTVYYEVADHVEEAEAEGEDPRVVSIPEWEFARLQKLGAVEKKGSKAAKEAAEPEPEAPAEG